MHEHVGLGIRDVEQVGPVDRGELRLAVKDDQFRRLRGDDDLQVRDIEVDLRLFLHLGIGRHRVGRHQRYHPVRCLLGERPWAHDVGGAEPHLVPGVQVVGRPLGIEGYDKRCVHHPLDTRVFDLV